MLGFCDVLNICFYFLFVVGVGVVFAKRSRNTSDFFRGGGGLPWWLVGTSAWMASFSAWTFTGAAAKMYADGPYVFGLYYAAIVPLLLLLSVTGARFRRMRVVTPLEAVRLRYGAGTQQFFAWMRLPFQLLFSSVALNALGVFMASVFSVPLPVVIIALGVAVTLLALLGGSFGVVAGDFVQMLLVVTVTVAVAVLALGLPDVGGLAGLRNHAPAAHSDWSLLARPGLIAAWVASLTVTKLFESNAMDASSKYLMARGERNARLTALVPLVGIVLAPLVWLIPPTVAAIRHPDLAALFPALKYPQEAAFLATATDVLPHGMLGLLVCGIFAATMSNLNAELNQGAGIFVRNIYLPLFRPDSDEPRLLRVGKMATAVFGGLDIAAALMIERLRDANLFDLLNQMAVSLAIPLALPLVYGLYVRRTPAWSAWSTAAVGLACSWGVKCFFRPAALDGWFGLHAPFLPEEITQLRLIATVVCVTLAGSAWYFASTLFYDRSSATYRRDVAAFFVRLSTPVATDERRPCAAASPIVAWTGILCMLYGGFVSACALFPNPWQGRFCFLACGGAMLAVGLLLRAMRRSR